MRPRLLSLSGAAWLGAFSLTAGLSTAIPAAAEPERAAPNASGSGVPVERVVPSAMHIPGPSLAGWQPLMGPGADENAPQRPQPGSAGLLEVTDFEVDLYPDPSRRFYPIGTARLGSLMPASGAKGSDCKDGDWYRVSAGAYVCTGDGARVLDRGQERDDRRPNSTASGSLWQPSNETPHPFLYARVIADRGPKLTRLPALDADGKAQISNDIVERWMVGDYFLALAGEHEHGGQRYYQTLRGKFVRADDLDIKSVQPIHGEHLGRDVTLPLAFTLDDSPLHCRNGAGLEHCGTIAKHARFAASEPITHQGAEFLAGPEGTLVEADALRIAKPVQRPSGIPARAKWIHIDLAQQVLVAYEGDQPVFTTLVSSGRDGYYTPAGVYRVQRKYFTKTMRGDDDKSGSYEVQEVPWVMYYDGNYALHGAYWHNLFGRTKSHGCVNIPPVDARWLYHWSTLELPVGWHSMYHRRGTYIYISGQTPRDGH